MYKPTLNSIIEPTVLLRSPVIYNIDPPIHPPKYIELDMTKTSAFKTHEELHNNLKKNVQSR
jgi:hypothetical protein